MEKDKLIKKLLEESGQADGRTEASAPTVMETDGRTEAFAPTGMETDGRTGSFAPAIEKQPKGRGAEKREEIITSAKIREAMEILKKYKADKAETEARITEEHRWWLRRHWEMISSEGDKNKPKPTSAWMFNVIANKHADAMDNFPEPNILPRALDDEKDAKTLSSIIPVILERNDFEKTYSNAWYYKLRHGFVPYGVTWNTSAADGLGDIEISEIDALNIFWEKGISDIQKSRNLFITNLVDTDILEAEYPQFAGKFSSGTGFDIKRYDESIDLSKKSLVVDWYYKKYQNGKSVLHFVKFSGEAVLFATENEEEYRETGLYEHGKYPVVFDVLYPLPASPIGFGMIAITKSPQLYIDKLDSVLLENAVLHARPRYFTSRADGVNEEEFLDVSRQLVHVEGGVSDDRLKPIEVPSVGSYAMNMLQQKIQEMKETSSNNDATNGSGASGVTSGAAISALQEAGNKQSRDMISASYRTYREICFLVIELIRQFYDEARSFRITGADGGAEFVEYSNASLNPQSGAAAYLGQSEEEYSSLTRKPIFDIDVKPQKRSAYSKLSQNSMAKEFYQMGFFNPEYATQSLACIEMMDFDGKEKIKSLISQGQTLYKQLQAAQQENAQLLNMLGGAVGQTGGQTGAIDPATIEEGLI